MRQIGRAPALAGLVSLMVALTACGAPAPAAPAAGGASGGSAAPAAAPVAATPASVMPQAPAAQPAGASFAANPKRGGVYRTVNLGWAHLDPHQNLSAGLNGSGPAMAYSGVLSQRRGPDAPAPGFKIEGDLAERWEQKDDVTLIFYLRKGVKWPNVAPVNGREVVASDVVYSTKRQATPGFTNASLLSAMKDIEAVDPYTVKITLKEPSASFLNLFSSVYTIVVAKEVVEANKDLKNAPIIATGPWIIKDADSKQGFIAERNPDYYLKGLPILDKIDFRVIPDTATQLAAFRSKKLDTVSALPKDAELIQNTNKEVKRLIIPDPSSGVELAMKVSKAPYSDIKVRTAISKAINRKELRDTVYFGAGIQTVGIMVPAENWLLTQDEFDKGYDFDVAGAKKLLAEAGFPNGFSAELVVARYADDWVTHGEFVANGLKQIGINATIKIIDPPTYTAKYLLGGEFDHMYIGPIPGGTADADQRFAMFETGNTRNVMGVSDAKLDAMIKAQRTAVDPEKRRPLILDIQRHLVEQKYDLITRGTVGNTLYWPYVKDFYPGPAFNRWSWLRMWIDPDDASAKGR